MNCLLKNQTKIPPSNKTNANTSELLCKYSLTKGSDFTHKFFREAMLQIFNKILLIMALGTNLRGLYFLLFVKY